jgi:hypothetical protein
MRYYRNAARLIELVQLDYGVNEWNRGSIPGRRQETFLHSFQTGSAVFSASRSMGIGVPSER